MNPVRPFNRIRDVMLNILMGIRMDPINYAIFEGLTG